MRPEFVFQSCLGRAVEDALSAVPATVVNTCIGHVGDWVVGGEGASLVRDEDLEAVDNLGERYGSVLPPILYRLRVVHEDHEVLFCALVMHLRIHGISTSHLGYVLVSVTEI